ncbi:MAG: futalosine hydrolase [Streptomyces sp.]|uniref:futalosine hydrolase n=1 Tax=Streptomyces sp. TaxID=1931 RepID=UPI003D6AB2AF
MSQATLRVLIVTAVAAERDAVTAALPGGHAPPPESGQAPGQAPMIETVAAGVGPAAAAAGTATALTVAAAAGEPFGLVISAGIAGGFPPCGLGATVLATSIVAADLGAVTPTGFASVTELGFGTVEHRPPDGLVKAAAEATGAVTGPVLTVSTVTGTAERAGELAARHPGAVAEAMEGFGVAEAASAHGVPVLEIRTVSNPVGPRDRAAWRIPEALAALGGSCAALLPVLRAWRP